MKNNLTGLHISMAQQKWVLEIKDPLNVLKNSEYV